MRLQVRELSKRFGHVWALREVSFTVEAGELAVLLGPSGSGKTTLLWLVAGLEEPTSGQVLFDGKNVSGASPRHRNVGMVFQNYALYPHMSVLDNIAFPLRLQGLSSDERQARVREVARMLSIEELLQRRPDQLSGGQQQRVALARALVKRPAVLLLDEPLANLDPVLRRSAREEIRSLQRRLGITTLWVTHDRDEAMAVGDRLIVLREGRLVQEGPPTEVYRRPKDAVVATLLGEINLWPAQLRQCSSGWNLWVDGWPEPIARWPCRPEEVRGGDDCLAGVRPEDVVVHPDGPAELLGVEPWHGATMACYRLGPHRVRALLLRDQAPATASISFLQGSVIVLPPPR